jgi:formamidopyrimidine-DNA glycosylase
MRRGLALELDGATIRQVTMLKPDILMDGMTPRDFASQLQGRRIVSVDRRGKNLLLKLPASESQTGQVVLVQVRMTGRFVVAPGSDPQGSATADRLGWSHIAARIQLEDDRTVLYDDVRRLGGFRLLSLDAWQSRDSALGPEPLAEDFTAAELTVALSGGRGPIKNALLNQRRLVGIGNIYASEALHRARLSPTRAVPDLTDQEVADLHGAIRAVLSEALDASGTSLKDYRAVNGQPGKYQDRLRVYDREGQPCNRCVGEIHRLLQAGRSSYYCPGCQR